jgi:hypothetical protein
VLRLVALVGMVSGCDVVWSVDRVPPPDAPGPCVATDDFAGDRLGNQWATFQNNPLFVIAQNETLRLELSANSAPGEAGVRYGVAFDMTGGSIEVEVAQVVNAHPNVETYLRVREGTDNSRNYTIRYGDGALDFRTRLGTDNIHRQRAYSATADRWWRISNGARARSGIVRHTRESRRTVVYRDYTARDCAIRKRADRARRGYLQQRIARPGIGDVRQLRRVQRAAPIMCAGAAPGWRQ